MDVESISEIDRTSKCVAHFSIESIKIVSTISISIRQIVPHRDAVRINYEQNDIKDDEGKFYNTQLHLALCVPVAAGTFNVQRNLPREIHTNANTRKDDEAEDTLFRRSNKSVSRERSIRYLNFTYVVGGKIAIKSNLHAGTKVKKKKTRTELVRSRRRRPGGGNPGTRLSRSRGRTGGGERVSKGPEEGLPRTRDDTVDAGRGREKRKGKRDEVTGRSRRPSTALTFMDIVEVLAGRACYRAVTARDRSIICRLLTHGERESRRRKRARARARECTSRKRYARE